MPGRGHPPSPATHDDQANRVFPERVETRYDVRGRDHGLLPRVNLYNSDPIFITYSTSWVGS